MSTRNWRRRLARDLRSQILLWIVFPVATILLVLSFHGIYSHQQAMRALVEERDLALATVGAQQAADSLGRCQAVLENIRDQEALRHGRADDYSLLLQEMSPQLRVFEGGVALLAADGGLIAAEPDGPAWAATVQAVNPHLELVTTGKAPTLLITLQGPNSSGPLVALIVPGVGAVGALLGVFSPESCGIVGILDDFTMGPEGVAYLADGEGTILYHPDHGRSGDNILTYLGMGRDQLTEAGAGVYRDGAGQDVVLAHAPVGQTAWTVIVQEPWGSLLSPIMRYSVIAPVVVLVVALGAFLIIYLGVRQVLQPLEDLRRRASKIAWGDFSAASEPVGGIAEIDELRVTLNQMADKIRAYQTAMHSYVAAVTQGQEEERLRLGHELHDDTVQSLVVLSQELERAQRDLPAAAEGSRQQLYRLRKLANSTIDDLRRYISDLRPIYLEDLGLIPALEKLVDDLALGQHLDAQLRVVGRVGRLPADIELAVFRIVQEALNNVEQYSQASQVQVEMEFRSDALAVAIEDDGVGFEAPEKPSELTERGHFGLLGMQERAMLLGGRLSIESEPGQGSRIAFYVPITRRP